MRYFDGKISQGFVALSSGRVILMATGALLGLFLPIFLYELFDLNIKYVIYYYLIGNLAYGLLVAWGCKYLNKIGLRRSLKIGVIWGALFYVVLYYLDRLVGSGVNFQNDKKIILFLIGLSILFLTLNRLMYWVPVHTDISKFTDKSNRGKELSMIEAAAVAMRALMPLVAGWILLSYSYDILFLIAIFIYFSALVPLASLPKTKEKFSWTYLETWKEFFSKKRIKIVLAYMGDGAENAMGIIFWPIFIWKLLDGNYFEVGALTSLIVLVTVFLQLMIGKFTDVKNKKQLLKYGTIFYSLGWVIKIFIATAFQIFITSTYHNLARVFTRTPFDTINYEMAADQGHYVDEFTVIHEMAIQFGRAIVLILALILLPFVSMQWIFLLAALASLALNFISDDDLIKEKYRV